MSGRPARIPWPDPRPVPPYIQDALGLGQTISAIGTTVFTGIRAYAEQHNIQIEGLPADPEAEIPPERALHIIHNFLAIQFPLLHPAAPVNAGNLPSARVHIQRDWACCDLSGQSVAFRSLVGSIQLWRLEGPLPCESS